MIIAEVRSDTARRVAVAPGGYAVRLWRKGTVVAGRLDVADGALTAVRWEDLRPIDLGRPAAKGDAVAVAKDDALTHEAQRVYDDNMLSFGTERPVVSQGETTIVRMGYRGFLGKRRRGIDTDDFLHRIRRDDLVDVYRSRAALRRMMTVTVGARSCSVAAATTTTPDAGCSAGLPRSAA